MKKKLKKIERFYKSPATMLRAVERIMSVEIGNKEAYRYFRRNGKYVGGKKPYLIRI